MTNEWIDWSDSRLRIPLRVNGYPYPQTYYVDNGSGSNSNSSTANSSTAVKISNSCAGSISSSSLSCFTSHKFHLKAKKLKQLYTTAGRLKGNCVCIYSK